MTDLVIAVCVPVHSWPDMPEQTTDCVYEQAPCPECKRAMWLGLRTKQLHADRGARLMCIPCALRLGYIDETTVVHKLGGGMRRPDSGGPDDGTR